MTEVSLEVWERDDGGRHQAFGFTISDEEQVNIPRHQVTYLLRQAGYHRTI